MGFLLVPKSRHRIKVGGRRAWIEASSDSSLKTFVNSGTTLCFAWLESPPPVT